MEKFGRLLSDQPMKDDASAWKKLFDSNKISPFDIECIEYLKNRMGGIEVSQQTVAFTYVLSFIAAHLSDEAMYGHFECLVSCLSSTQKTLTACAEPLCAISSEAGNRPSVGLRLLPEVIALFQGGKSQLLTPIHAIFAKCCIVARMYKRAVPVVEQLLYELDKKSNGLKIEDFLLYYHYAGMIHIGLKRFDKALEDFQMVFIIPAVNTASAIQVESYKKFLLCHLIAHGTIPVLPRSVSESVQNYTTTLSSHYSLLADAFSHGNLIEFERIAHQHEKAFTEDGNVGLIRQVVDALTRSQIRKLTQTYLTMNLEQVAQEARTSRPLAEVYLVSMIENSSISATVEHKRDGIDVVRFGDDCDESDSMVATLGAKVREVIGIQTMLRKAMHNLELDQKVLSKSLKEKDRSASSGGSIEDQQLQQALRASMHSGDEDEG